jgi:hypothetical protein
MSALAPVLTVSDALRVTLLYRKLQYEMNEVHEIIERSGLHDEMTQRIRHWHEHFERALHSPYNSEKVCSHYITLMQQLLTDPITQAPLDALSWLGSDGTTYGNLSLEVHKLTVADEFRGHSPLDPKNPAPFHVEAHPVVRHMIGWLQRHNALLYNEELERTYLELLPQANPDADRERIDRIVARQMSLDRKEAERDHLQNRALDKRLDGRLRAWQQELEERFAPLKARLGKPIAFPALDFHAVKQGIHEEDIALARLREGLAAMARPLQTVQEQADFIAAEERSSKERLKAKIQERVGQVFKPIAQAIKAFTQAEQERIQALSERDQESMAQFDRVVQTLRAEIVDLTRQNHELERAQRDVAVQLTATQREEAALQQGINETKIAIDEMKDRSFMKIVSTVTLVGACIFGAWAIHGVLTSAGAGAGAAASSIGSSFGFGAFPVHGGAGLKASFWLF